LSKPQAIWTLKKSPKDKYHSYIFISLASTTKSLIVDENGKVAENNIPGIKYDVPTLYMGMFEDGSILQVFTSGFKHISKTAK
jgi:hypothetical protein